MESVKVWFALPTDAAYALQHALRTMPRGGSDFYQGDIGSFWGETAMVHCGLLHWFFNLTKTRVTRGSIGLSPFPSNSHHQDYYMFSRGFLCTFICNFFVEGGQPNDSSMFDSTQQSTIFCSLRWYSKVVLDPFGMMKNFHIFIAVDPQQTACLFENQIASIYIGTGKKTGWSLVEVLLSQKQTFHLGAAWYFFNPDIYVHSISSWIFCMKLCGCVFGKTKMFNSEKGGVFIAFEWLLGDPSNMHNLGIQVASSPLRGSRN